MMPTEPDRPILPPEEAVLVRRIAELSRAPELDASQRVRLQADLDRRLARRRRRLVRPLWAGALATGLAAFAWVRLGSVESMDPVAMRVDREPVAEAAGRPVDPAVGASAQALLSLMNDDAQSVETDLPDDYAAIGSLLLGSGQ